MQQVARQVRPQLSGRSPAHGKETTIEKELINKKNDFKYLWVGKKIKQGNVIDRGY